MKIWCFYWKWKVCFPHVWELIKCEYDDKGVNWAYYRCAVCGKEKRKKVKEQ